MKMRAWWYSCMYAYCVEHDIVTWAHNKETGGECPKCRRLRKEALR